MLLRCVSAVSIWAKAVDRECAQRGGFLLRCRLGRTGLKPCGPFVALTGGCKVLEGAEGLGRCLETCLRGDVGREGMDVRK